jgi:ubiquinone biosynthesis protein
MLALQPDILSLQYCNSLFNLLDHVPPFGFEQVEKIFREEFGLLPAEMFDAIDPVPIAAASLGQVHVAWLNGKKLAVKVQRPTVERDFLGDIRLMSAAIRVIRGLKLRPFYWMIEPMSEFVAWTREEMDYHHEARYMRQLLDNAQQNAHERVPELMDRFTTRRTLVMEFMEGHTVLAYLRALESGNTRLFEQLDAGGFDSHALASHIIDNFLGDVFEHGMFHADLHPANLMILPENVVGYIDFGITGVISRYSRQRLVALTLAYTRGDLEGMCKAFFQVSTMDSDASKVRFRNGLAHDARGWYESEGGQVRLRKNFTLVMLDMLRLSRATGIFPERDVIKYIRSAIAIDGLITRFAPTFDSRQHLEKVCDRYLKWQVRSGMFTWHRMLGWATANGSLLRDGGLRALDALDRLANSSHWAGKFGGARSRHAPWRLAYCAGFLFLTCWHASGVAGPVHFGMNLFTAEAALAACALLLCVGHVQKLQGGERCGN